MDITIRKIQDKDFDLATDIAYFKVLIPKIKKYKTLQSTCFVAEYDNQIIGFICGEKTKICDNILFAGEVKQEFQHQGVFSQLLSAYENECKNETITIYCNNDLVDYYIKQGYCVGENLKVLIKENK